MILSTESLQIISSSRLITRNGGWRVINDSSAQSPKMRVLPVSDTEKSRRSHARLGKNSPWVRPALAMEQSAGLADQLTTLTVHVGCQAVSPDCIAGGVGTT
jgi:hypothetical protein